MSLYLLIFSVIIVTCVFLNKVSGKVGIPVLLLFLVLGLVCGSVDNDFADKSGWLVGKVSTIALVFIMFYGGFGTRWKAARPVVVEAGLLASVGVVLTAAFVGLFCHFVLRWAMLESFLMGAVIGSTDAATVFSILRSRKLGLKNNSAPMIEVESGSNDPVSYMLTSVMISAISGSLTAGAVIWTVLSQIVLGAGVGLVIANGSVLLMRRISVKKNGFDLLLFIAVALVSYAVPDLLGGNGYLSAYIVGIVLGNVDFPARKSLVSLFDSLTGLTQIVIFFLLGALAVPSHLVGAFLPALLIFLFLTFAARPLAVSGVLVPFRKYPANQLALVSFAGLRGAASIVFAILILTSDLGLDNDIFSIVFCIVLMSIAIQGSLLPRIAKGLNMIDESENVMTTFSDFKESTDVSFGNIEITHSNRWRDKSVRDLELPQGCLVVLIMRGGRQIVPEGGTIIREGDSVVICSPSYEDKLTDNLIQHTLDPDSRWDGHMVRDYPNTSNTLLLMIQRGEERIIPHGDTVLRGGDCLILLRRSPEIDG